MISPPKVLDIPNVLAAQCHQVETFFARAHTATPARQSLVLDMRAVSFVTPYGVLALLGVALERARRRQALPMILRNLAPKVHSYLDRVDLFSSDPELFVAEQELVKVWDRNPASETILPISVISDKTSLAQVEIRIERIFKAHLGDGTGHVTRVISELCGNILEHSGDIGYTIVQKTSALPYSDGRPRVCLRVAVWDAGQGVHAALRERHPHLTTPIDALEGILKQQLSSNERGGLGIFSVTQRTKEFTGALWLRSQDAAVYCLPDRSRSRSGLTAMPGTQGAVTLHFPQADA